ncbi:hypothetical protein INT48_006673 [Thamnidium elegans]|uniref:Uncharacterized protein n=1 Tax=Thamnidium elegans TaxID=101142 RepID=A0A8H7SH91_9FUNG|nr:hypothetical protein INT48_006673 [Thamnidium elegans]
MNTNSEQQMINAIEALGSKVDSISSRLDTVFGPTLTGSDLNSFTERSLTDIDYVNRAIYVQSVNTTDSANRTRVIQPNPYGLRKGEKPYSSTRRIDDMFRLLHTIQHGEEVAPLSKFQLKEQRSQLKGIARSVLSSMQQDGFSLVSSWKDDVKDIDKKYYSLLLEQRADTAGMFISRCKSSWCARLLLQEGFKAKKQAHKKKSKRQFDRYLEEQAETIRQEESAAPSLDYSEFSILDNESTTSNIA